MFTLYLSMLDIESDKLDFEKFYRLYKDDVYAYALSIVKNKEDAEDAAQNTWMWLAGNYTVFRAKDAKSVKVYLMRVVRSRAIDIYRKNKREERMRAAEYQEAVNENDDALLYAICEKQNVNEIVACIYSLEEIYRDVLNLYYLNQNNTREIADILRIKESTARQRLTRGRKQLIRLLKERGLTSCRNRKT